MVRWQCNLSVSRRSRRFSLLAHGNLLLLMLLVRWPEGYPVLWPVLLVAIVLAGCIRSQKNIALLQGTITLKGDNVLIWKGREWRIKKQPWIIGSGVLFLLQRTTDNRCLRLWLASDSMRGDEWRHLRQLLRQYADFSPRD